MANFQFPTDSSEFVQAVLAAEYNGSNESRQQALTLIQNTARLLSEPKNKADVETKGAKPDYIDPLKQSVALLGVVLFAMGTIKGERSTANALSFGYSGASGSELYNTLKALPVVREWYAADDKVFARNFAMKTFLQLFIGKAYAAKDDSLLLENPFFGAISESANARSTQGLRAALEAKLPDIPDIDEPMFELLASSDRMVCALPAFSEPKPAPSEVKAQEQAASSGWGRLNPFSYFATSTAASTSARTEQQQPQAATSALKEKEAEKRVEENAQATGPSNSTL